MLEKRRINFSPPDISDIEIATAIGEAIQLSYVPSLESIC